MPCRRRIVGDWFGGKHCLAMLALFRNIADDFFEAFGRYKLFQMRRVTWLPTWLTPGFLLLGIRRKIRRGSRRLLRLEFVNQVTQFAFRSEDFGL